MDIVERLRKGKSAGGYWREKEAADEIERLREEIENLHREERSTAIQHLGNEGQWNDLVAAKDAEIERLKQINERFAKILNGERVVMPADGH